jgi:hypothetical protein
VADMLKPGFQHEQRWIPFDLILGQQVQATFQPYPLLIIHKIDIPLPNAMIAAGGRAVE